MATYRASCHCGAVHYNVDLSLEGLATCNCSMCGRTGAVMAFVGPDAISDLTGEDKLTDYQFGKRSIHHAFCSVCGMRPLAWGTTPEGHQHYMINVRCLEGIDPAELTVAQAYDGRSL